MDTIYRKLRRAAIHFRMMLRQRGLGEVYVYRIPGEKVIRCICNTSEEARQIPRDYHGLRVICSRGDLRT